MYVCGSSPPFPAKNDIYAETSVFWRRPTESGRKLKNFARCSLVLRWVSIYMDIYLVTKVIPWWNILDDKNLYILYTKDVCQKMKIL